MKTYLYRLSNLKSTITLLASVSWWKSVSGDRRFLRFSHNNYNYHNHQLLQTGFLEYTEAIATSRIPLDTILHEKCAFIIGFSCTVWTKRRSLAGSLADGVLADAILIPPCPPILPTNIRMVRGHQKGTVSKRRKGDGGMAKCFSNKYGNKG